MIECKIRKQLALADQMYCICIGERVRTTMKWYTREALRFGTQSTSMLYSRWEIEKLVEGTEPSARSSLTRAASCGSWPS